MLDALATSTVGDGIRRFIPVVEKEQNFRIVVVLAENMELFDSQSDFICDRLGQRYEISIERTCHILWLYAKHGEKRIGEASCHVQEDVWEVSDLFVRNDVLRPANWFVRTFVPTKWRTINYRNRGIGSAFLDLIIHTARCEGCKRIVGRVVAKDYDENPNLLRWYERKGFSVLVEPPESDAIAQIMMDLREDG